MQREDVLNDAAITFFILLPHEGILGELAIDKIQRIVSARGQVVGYDFDDLVSEVSLKILREQSTILGKVTNKVATFLEKYPSTREVWPHLGQLYELAAEAVERFLTSDPEDDAAWDSRLPVFQCVPGLLRELIESRCLCWDGYIRNLIHNQVIDLRRSKKSSRVEQPMDWQDKKYSILVSPTNPDETFELAEFTLEVIECVNNRITQEEQNRLQVLQTRANEMQFGEPSQHPPRQEPQIESPFISEDPLLKRIRSTMRIFGLRVQYARAEKESGVKPPSDAEQARELGMKTTTYNDHKKKLQIYSEDCLSSLEN